MIRRLALLFAFVLGGTVSAQRLVVNGVDIPEFTNALEPGTAYVAAEPFARAIGATYRFDGQAVAFELAGRFVVATLDDATNPNDTPGGLTGAVRLQGRVPYVPVKETAQQLGGMVDYLTDARLVVVVFPRAQLLGVTSPNPWGSFERFTLRFDAPVAVEERFEPSLSTVRFRFPRTDSERKQNFSGARFTDAVLSPGNGYADFMVTLAQGSTYDMYAVPVGEGTEVIVDVFAEEVVDEEAAPGAAQPEANDAFVVIDAGRSSDAAAQLGAALGARGVTAVIADTSSLQTRRAASVGAPLFITLDTAPLETGQFGLYYLGASGSASASLDLDTTIHRNATQLSADAENSTMPQRVLQRLTPDLALGETYAQMLSQELTQSGWQPVRLEGAPLYVLSGAAGRGLLLELSPTDLADPSMLEALADALTALLGS